LPTAGGLPLPLERLPGRTFGAESSITPISFRSRDRFGLRRRLPANCLLRASGDRVNTRRGRSAAGTIATNFPFFVQPRLAVCAFAWADVADRTRRTLTLKGGGEPDRSQAPESLTANDNLAWLCTPDVEPVHTARRWRRHAQPSRTSLMATPGAAQASPSAASAIPEAYGNVRTARESRGAGATPPVVSPPKGEP